MRISDRSSDVCSSDLLQPLGLRALFVLQRVDALFERAHVLRGPGFGAALVLHAHLQPLPAEPSAAGEHQQRHQPGQRSEEHTSELQSLMRISYAVFCLKKKTNKQSTHSYQNILIV